MDDFRDLPQDARDAFDRAVRHYKRTYPEHAHHVGAWSDIARDLWTTKADTARPNVLGWQRAKGLVIASRLIVWNVALAFHGRRPLSGNTI